MFRPFPHGLLRNSQSILGSQAFFGVIYPHEEGFKNVFEVVAEFVAFALDLDFFPYQGVGIGGDCRPWAVGFGKGKLLSVPEVF
jgi:hypothetical protein